MSYENRIALGNLVPTIGQFKVMDKIPQYQQCEVHNLVEAPAEVPEVLRHVVFNIERGQTLHETIDFLNMCPDFKNMDIIYANELDDGAVRSGNCNVAYEIAKSIGMNYAYGLEFIELVNPNDNKGFHGNALFSRWPIRWRRSFTCPSSTTGTMTVRSASARALPLSARSTSAAVKSARSASIWRTARTARAAKPRWQSCMMRSKSRSRRTRRS